MENYTCCCKKMSCDYYSHVFVYIFISFKFAVIFSFCVFFLYHFREYYPLHSKLYSSNKKKGKIGTLFFNPKYYVFLLIFGAEVIQADSTTSEEVGLEQLPYDSATGGDAISFDSLFSELDEAEGDPSSSAQSATLNPPQLLQRESVLLRLAKRIKVGD